jgi:dephospho-CoA kinase
MVILGYVDQETQIKRLCTRDSLSTEAAEARVKMQMPLEAKCAFTNEIIDNRKSLQEVREDVIRIYTMIRATGH